VASRSGAAIRLLGVSLVVLALGACTRAEVGAGALAVAAKVNGNAVSLQQINSLIERGALEGLLQPSAAQALERVIDQELLVQKALEAKLDHDPRLDEAVDAARRQFLAQAYLEAQAAALPASSEQEIRAFYSLNPALFERRRIYTYRSLTSALPESRARELRAEMLRSGSLEALAQWLDAQGLAFEMASATRSAEDLPLNQLARLHTMKNGELALLPVAGAAAVLQLVHAQEAPIAAEQARPAIERFLASRKRAELAEQQLRELRRQARIEYYRDFKIALSTD
jgi:EpsD family peptidyl-prolyl cis-trans isomerase